MAITYTPNGANIPLNIPKRHKKGVMKTFGTMVPPFYRVADAMLEGSPVVLDDQNPGFLKLAVPGECENGVFGLVAQQVYDAEVLGELSGYMFHNNTKAKQGDVVGVITGQGYVELLAETNVDGTAPVAGDKIYPAAGGKVSVTATGNDMPVGVVDAVRDDGYLLVRVNFNWYFDVAQATP